MDNTAVTKVKPNSLEAEQSVIGAIIADPNVVDDASEVITKDDFYHQQYGLIFEAMVQLKSENKPMDLVTIIEQLTQNGAPPETKDASHLKYLAESVSIASDVKTYAEIVKNKAVLRQIIDRTREIENMCFAERVSSEEILDTTEKTFFQMIQKRGIADAVPIHEIVGSAMENIYAALERKGSLTGLSTGFIDLDNITSGMQNSDLILVAARPSMGKTAFALNIANHVALREKKAVAIFSLEMSETSLVTRLFSIDAGIEATAIRTANLEDYDWQRLTETADEIAKSKLIIDGTSDITMAKIRSKCRKYKQKHDISLVIIDYLQLIGSEGGSESRQQEISNISRSLKALARELNIPVIALSQLNRGVEQRDDKRPMLSDLRDSGAIEQDADVVMLLYREDYYKKDEAKNKGISEVIIAKQRNGPTGTVKLQWHAKYTSFKNRTNAKSNFTEND